MLAGLLLIGAGTGGCAWGWDPDDDTVDPPGDDDSGDDDAGGDDDSGDDDDDSGDDDSGDDDDTISPAAIADQTYFLDLSTFEITYPPGVGYALSQYLPTTHGSIFMITAVNDQTGHCEVLFGGGQDSEGDPDLDDWAQDLAQPTVLPACSWSNPALQVGPVTEVDVVIPDKVTGHLLDVSFTGGFLPDGSAMVGAELTGLMDLYSMDVWQGEPPGTSCDFLDQFGFPCVPCPAGPHQGQVFCTDVLAVTGTIPRLPGLVMVGVAG